MELAKFTSDNPYRYPTFISYHKLQNQIIQELVGGYELSNRARLHPFVDLTGNRLRRRRRLRLTLRRRMNLKCQRNFGKIDSRIQAELKSLHYRYIRGNIVKRLDLRRMHHL